MPNKVVIKKGTLVRHCPSGCVGEIDHDVLCGHVDLTVGFLTPYMPERRRLTTWPVRECEVVKFKTSMTVEDIKEKIEWVAGTSDAHDAYKDAAAKLVHDLISENERIMSAAKKAQKFSYELAEKLRPVFSGIPI